MYVTPTFGETAERREGAARQKPRAVRKIARRTGDIAEDLQRRRNEAAVVVLLAIACNLEVGQRCVKRRRRERKRDGGGKERTKTRKRVGRVIVAIGRALSGDEDTHKSQLRPRGRRSCCCCT